MNFAYRGLVAFRTQFDGFVEWKNVIETTKEEETKKAVSQPMFKQNNNSLPV